MSRSHNVKPRHSPSVRADIELEKTIVAKADRAAAAFDVQEGTAKLEAWDLWALEPDAEDDYDPGCECGACAYIRAYLNKRRAESNTERQGGPDGR